eukprot:TRINITY_DN11152_c0_g2_i3.p1 TRINITY_DN11152_c0_g2~~TRINITY_DN11152_c0_g2_i3.p1  ORF type:complete len:376 (-),score=87.78 TRINITY_DN11152_c0_g2_i3:19-1146(-)
MRLSRSKNLLRASQVIPGKENIFANRYGMALQNAVNAVRPSSRDSRVFRNITNLYPKAPQRHEDVPLKRFLRPRAESKSSKSVIGVSFTTRQVEANKSINVIDSRKREYETIPKGNPQDCNEYVPEIAAYTRSIEGKFKIDPLYMNTQKDINNTMRSILIDWLVDVNIRFKLLPETLFLTVNIIDRYLQSQQVKKHLLQLVGVTAAFIASKYEEIYPPEIKDFVYITDYAYTKDEILLMEQKVLKTLEFNLNIPSSNRFLQYFAKTMKSSKKVSCLAQFLLELSLVDAKMLKHSASATAAAALYISKKLNNDFEKLDEAVEAVTNYTKNSLTWCAKDMIEVLKESSKSSLQAVRKKFATVKYMEVGRIKIDKKVR